ncbi:MAG: hypothetical protein EA351_01055 [Gemmatimonadales bacterium]|nr:MAG: hypothetical protein EA351_01055 [Gemmatimonadales bacterium]
MRLWRLWRLWRHLRYLFLRRWKSLTGRGLQRRATEVMERAWRECSERSAPRTASPDRSTST